MKKILKALLIFLLIICVTGCGKKEVKEEKEKINYINPILYKVTKEGSDNTIYLLGSIHAANKSDLNFADYVMNAYNSSDYTAFEFDLVKYEKDLQKQIDDAKKLLNDDGSTLKDHVSEEQYNKIVNFLKEHNLYNSLYFSYKMVMIESLISSSSLKDAGLNQESGIDKYFINQSNKDKKEILEIENSDFQMDLLANFSDELYLFMINDVIDNYDAEVEGLKKLYDAWKNGDYNSIIELAFDEYNYDTLTDHEKEMIDEYTKALLDDRNINMTNIINDYFTNNKNVFVVVGIAHIIGDDGIVNQLSNMGYNVERVNN